MIETKITVQLYLDDSGRQSNIFYYKSISELSTKQNSNQSLFNGRILREIFDLFLQRNMSEFFDQIVP